MDLKAIGDQIIRLRKKRGLSQEALAFKAKIARGAVQQIESGHGNPTIETLAAIGQALDHDFLGQGPLDLTAAADFLSTFANLPPKAQRFVLALVYGDLDVISSLPAKVISVFSSAGKGERAKF